MIEVNIETGEQVEVADIEIPIITPTQSEVFQYFDSLTREFITETIKQFDSTNNTTFRTIDAFTKYTYDVNDPRYAIAISFLTWNSSVWSAVVVQRDTYLSTLVIPSDSNFIASLPLKA